MRSIMNQKGRSNNQYFETFAFGDSSEMADELLKRGLPETEATGNVIQKGADLFLKVRRRFALKYLN